MKAREPHIILGISYNEWFKNHATLDYWSNLRKVENCVENYLFRYENFKSDNPFIIKSVFGNKAKEDILKNIEFWFNASLGAYNTIEWHT